MRKIAQESCAIVEPNEQKIYFGNSKKVTVLYYVDFQKIFLSTPEVKEFYRLNPAKGTGKYSLLVAGASEQANRAITNYCKSLDLSGVLCISSDYLEEVLQSCEDINLQESDITEEILKSL